MPSNIGLYFVLSNLKLLNANGSELSREQLLKLWDFYNLLKGSKTSSFIHRGDSDKNLRRQFNVDTGTPGVLAECLFMTGVKGKMCWTEDGGFNPDDYSTENFVNICRSLVNYIDNGLNARGNKSRRIKAFCENNVKFCKRIRNVTALVKIYEKLGPEDKKEVSLNYLALAHTINDPTYCEASGLVSTTTNPREAARFFRSICIYGWVPRNTEWSRILARTIDFVDINNDMEDIKQTGLPYYEIPVYPSQKEIALRCGFLPHFMIGFTVGKNFYVNPAIFAAIDKMREKTSFRELSDYKKRLQWFGLEIDQQNFVEFIRKTNFKRYYTFDGTEYAMYKI